MVNRKQYLELMRAEKAERLEEIRRRSVAGEPVTSIAAAMGLYRCTVSRHRAALARSGVRVEAVTEEELLRVVQEHAQTGVNTRVTAKQLRISKERITRLRRVLRSRGVSLRNQNFEHGRNGYSTYGCRCDICKAVGAAQKRAWGARVRAEIRAGLREVPSHGTAGYNSYGCRCEVCRAAYKRTHPSRRQGAS